MNFRTMTAAPLILAAAVMAPGAGLDESQWAWRAPLETTTAPRAFVRVEATEALLDVATPYLRDVRVVRSPGGEAPRLVLPRQSARSAPTVRWMSGALRNQVHEPRAWARADVEFPERFTRTSLKVTLSGDSFRRRVRVEGSDDATSWAVLRDNQWLFSVPASQPGPLGASDGTAVNAPVRADTLALPANNFLHLRVTAWNMPEDPERIEILSVTAPVADPAPPPPSVAVEARLLSVTHDPKERTSAWEFDLGTRNLVLSRAAVAFADEYFHRTAMLATRNETTQTFAVRTENGMVTREREAPWESGPCTVVYRVHDDNGVSERGDLPVAGVRPGRYLRLTVSNRDNPPLRLEKLDVERERAWVVFDNTAEGAYALLAGNPDAGDPDYDLRHSVRSLELASLPDVAMGPAERVARAEPQPPWSERNAPLIWAALGIGVAGMLFLLVRGLKHAGPPPGEGGTP